MAGWASINSLALLYNAKDAAKFLFQPLEHYTNPDLAFASVGPNNRLPDRRVLENFSGHNIDLRLLHHQGLLWQCQACLLSDGISTRPNGVSHYIALTNKFAKTLLPADSLDVDPVYQDFSNTIKKATKKTIPHGYQNNYFRSGMRSANPSI